jgi:hypothetical protein
MIKYRHPLTHCSAMMQTLHNLPAIDITPFVQRHGVLQDLKHSFTRTSARGSRSVTTVLYGVGGQGKTQIVINLCQSSWARTQFHNIFWINAASKKTAEDSFSQIAIEISRLHKHGSGYLRGEEFRSEVERWNTPWLFVFDNYDDDRDFRIQDFVPQSTYDAICVVKERNLIKRRSQRYCAYHYSTCRSSNYRRYINGNA